MCGVGSVLCADRGSKVAPIHSRHSRIGEGRFKATMGFAVISDHSGNAREATRSSRGKLAAIENGVFLWGPGAGDRLRRLVAWETERCRMARATAPILDSTET